MDKSPSSSTKFAIALGIGTVLGGALGFCYWLKRGGAVELWSALLACAGMGFLAAGILSFFELRLDARKRRILSDGFGNAWMSPWCRVYDEASEGCCFVKPSRPLRLPEELGLEQECVAQHKTLNNHYVLLHLRTSRASELQRLVAGKKEFKRALKRAFGGNFLRAQIALLLLEGAGLDQPELLGSLVDDVGAKSVWLLWVAGIDPANRKACLVINPLARPPTRTAVAALCEHLSSAGYQPEVVVKQKHDFFKAAEAAAGLHGAGILRWIAGKVRNFRTR
jgi:hypothetical protein